MKMQIDQSRNGVAAFSVQNIPVKLRRILFFINLSDLIPIQDNPAFYKCFVRCKNLPKSPFVIINKKATRNMF